jgi:hypothetical protein
MCVAIPRPMSRTSRCFTLHPAAAPREGLSVLVIDRTVGEAEELCAALREDGHVAEARAHHDDLASIIERLNPQVIAVRMRIGGGARATRKLVEKSFPHIRLIPYNAATLDTVRDELPQRWTELYELSPARMPNPKGFPRAVREVLEVLMSA